MNEDLLFDIHRRILQAFFSLDLRNPPVYRGFVQVTDLFLFLKDKETFEDVSDWNLFLKTKDLIIKKALELACFRHVKEPPMIPEELEFLDLNLILARDGRKRCPVCGEPVQKEKTMHLVECLSCGKTLNTGEFCKCKYFICEKCLSYHLQKVGCPTYMKDKKCFGRDCLLIK
ncbi:MAG: hypothetical protein ACTSWN_09380 [Promethearchaeota archaeon]